MPINDLTDAEKKLIRDNKGKPIYIRGERYTVDRSGQALDRNGVPLEAGAGDQVVAPTATPDPKSVERAEVEAAKKELGRAKTVRDANPGALGAEASYEQAKKKAKALGIAVEEPPAPPPPTSTPKTTSTPTDDALDEIAGRAPSRPTDVAIDSISGTGMPAGGLGNLTRRGRR